MKRFDVAIVGAGPAGLSAAKSAAQDGARTLLVDQKKEIGVPVRCGEFFPTWHESLRMWPDAHSLKSFYTLLPKEAISNKIRTIRLISPKNRVFEFKFEAYVLRRERFEKSLLHEAEKQGAILQLSTHIDGVREKAGWKKLLMDGANGKTFVESKILIGADGFPSKTGRLTNMGQRVKPQDVALCIQRRMENVKLLEEDIMEMYFSPKFAPGGFAWIIPKDGGDANVGLGVRFSRLSRTMPLVHNLQGFMNGHPFASRYFGRAKPTSLIGKTIPVGGLSANICRNRTLLVGDSAGAVLAVNGCGVPNALVSGHLAGSVASAHLNAACELSDYITAVRHEIGRVLQRGHLYRRIGDKFIYSDKALETIWQVLGAKNFATIFRCEPMRRLSIL